MWVSPTHMHVGRTKSTFSFDEWHIMLQVSVGNCASTSENLFVPDVDDLTKADFRCETVFELQLGLDMLEL